MKSVGRGEDLMRTLRPTQIHTVNCYLIKLKIDLFNYILTNTLLSRSPSEFPFEVGNSNL